MSSLLTGLNPNQKKAVTHEGSPLMILAGAGSGKTRVLTHRAAWLVKEQKINPDQLLLLTFTNKAAEEMRSRLLDLLSSTSLAATPFAGTFHSLCARILRKKGQILGIPPSFSIFDSQDQLSLAKNIMKELDLDPQIYRPSSLLSTISYAKNQGLTPISFAGSASGHWQEMALRLWRRYEQEMARYQALDFDDLLLQALNLFEKHPPTLLSYQNLFAHILVDEYQDTNQVQYLLTRLLTGPHDHLTVVGDASQSIYSWRGADYQNFPRLKVINLEQNYRSTQNILSAANAVISQATDHPILSLFTKEKNGPPITLYEAQNERSEAAFIADQIHALALEAGRPWSDFAVLCRTNAQSRVIEEAFLRASLPYILVGGTKFYERTEIKDIIALLRLCLSPSDQLSRQRAQKALGKRRLQAFDDFLKNLKNIPKTLILLEKIITHSRYLEKFDNKKPEDQSRLENIEELKSVARSFPALVDFLENIALVQQEYSQQEKQKDSSQPSISLMTIHSAKGLEFPVVFLPGLEEGILPHSRSLLDRMNLEEERRLAYVAITRTKEKLFLSFAIHRLLFGHRSQSQPSRFLSDIPLSLLEKREDLTPSSRPFLSSSSPLSNSLLSDPDLKRLFARSRDDLIYDDSDL